MKRTRRWTALAAATVAVGIAGWASRAPEPRSLLLPHSMAPTSFDKAAASPGRFNARWNIAYHGECCEGNLAAAGANTYVLLPVLVQGNKILRSTDNGVNWTRQYPLADASVPYGIEGDLQAWGDDVIFFGTELAVAVVSYSADRGDTWTTVQVPIASGGNDQAWSYLGPVEGLCPAPLSQTKPYVLGGWMRIGTVAVFSCDGGTTWPIQTPVIGNNGSGPEHVICQQNATPAADAGDTRVADAGFARLKAGRHGTFGTDRRFYWTETAGDRLYVCRTADFGQSWEGTVHAVPPGPGSGYVVTHAAFDERGTLYVVHGNRLYVSLDQGRSFRYTHVLPRFGNAMRSDAGADQYFAMHDGTLHLAALVARGAKGEVWYVTGSSLDSDAPVWTEELVDVVNEVRLDFMQIAVNGHGVPTISYTTPSKEVTTASLNPAAPADTGKLLPAAAGAPAGGLLAAFLLLGLRRRP